MTPLLAKLLRNCENVKEKIGKGAVTPGVFTAWP